MNLASPAAKAVLLMCALCLLAASDAYLLDQPHKQNQFTITRTPAGFVPNAIVIAQGDRIVFTSTTGKSFWPASNFHPSHALYPQFDPKRPLAPDEHWSFEFDQPGTWGFHDHMASEFQGTIVVRGTPRAVSGECAKLDPSELNPACWVAAIGPILNAKGMFAAFDYIDQLYETEPAFKRNCHDVMHYVGAIAYQKYLSSHAHIDRPETAYCGYGFYHGFMEAMQTAQGRGHYDLVRRYCQSVDAASGVFAGTACFHGIGHALFDSLDAEFWGDPQAMIASARKSCEQALSEESARVSCLSGVYNAFANAASAKNYRLSFDLFEPVSLCSAQKADYQQACYGEVALGYLRDKHWDRPQALSYIERLPAPLVPYEIFVYFGDEAKRALMNFDPETFKNACLALEDSLQNSCVRGVVEGLREEVPPAKAYSVEFPFCLSFGDEALRSHCLYQSLSKIRTDRGISAEFTAACNALPLPDLAKWCE